MAPNPVPPCLALSSGLLIVRTLERLYSGYQATIVQTRAPSFNCNNCNLPLEAH